MADSPSTSVSQKPLEAIVLAAGQGKRLKSQTPKVLHPLFGKSLLHRVLNAFEALQPVMGLQQVYLVIGHGREQVQAAVQTMDLSIPIFPVVQEPQLGTGHAVQQVKEAMTTPYQGDMLIATGDAPLMRASSLAKLVRTHQDSQSAITLLVATLDTPTGYGRVVMDGETLLKVVEEKDTTFEEKLIQTVNTGVYCLDWQQVAPLLDQLGNTNAQNEYYLTDIIALAVEKGLKVSISRLCDYQEMLGVNSREDLALCSSILNQRTQEKLLLDGVTLVDPVSTVVGPEVQIGSDTVLYPGCYLEGDIQIGTGCEIGPFTTLRGRVQIGDRTKVIHSLLQDSSVGDDSSVGPFAHLRDGAVLSHHVRVGNFVEVKNTRIDHHSNAAHLAYLGDADLGSEVNMGAGSITANYDPIRQSKHRTTIENGVKVGCNAVLVAPVTLGEGSCVAAGSVITHDVEEDALAIARPKQSAIAHWVSKVRRQLTSSK